MSIFNKLLKCLVVATVITPAAVTPAVAGCCGAYHVDSSSPQYGAITAQQSVEGPGLMTTNTVTNTSMTMIVTEDATFNPSSVVNPPSSQDPSSGSSSGEVM
jgi:hypothetical protein